MCEFKLGVLLDELKCLVDENDTRVSRIGIMVEPVKIKHGTLKPPYSLRLQHSIKIINVVINVINNIE